MKATIMSIKQLIILLPTLLALSLNAGDWPNWRGAGHNGISLEKEWGLERAKIAWRASVGVGFSSMAVAGNRVYTIGHNGLKKDGVETVHCLDAASGKTVWKDSYPAVLVDYLHEGGPCSTPTVDGDKLYTLSKDGRLKCYDAATGRVHWERDMMKAAGMNKPPEWGFAGSPYILGNKLLIEGAHTFALEKSTGREIWRSKRYRHAYGSSISFLLGKRTLIAALKTDGLVILDASDGSTVAFRKWETSFRTNSTTPIILPGGRIFISTGYQRGCTLLELTADGELKTLWQNRNLSNHMNNSVITGGHIYGFDGNTHMAGPKELVCLELATGKTMWRGGSELRCGSLLVAGGRILALGERGQLVEAPLSPKGFNPTSEIHALRGKCWTVPVLANGRIYARNARGDLVCVDAASK